MPTRKQLIESLEQACDSRVICYVTGDRRNQETQIGDDVLPFFSSHLSKIGKVKSLGLFIYSRGGNTLAGFALANALREFADNVDVLIPFRAHSCATLISLGANAIIAGPFAQLSPIDPSITTPHGPSIEQAGETKFLAVSVEDVANYFELARKEAGLKDEQFLSATLGHLCQRISPLALGAVYRAREQIGMLATKLLALHMNDQQQINKIVKQLSRELLSHDYIIGRREAKAMGLPVKDATDKEAELMWQIYEDVATELQLSEPWNWEKEAKTTNKPTCVRGIIESKDLKHQFSSTYDVKKTSIQKGNVKTDTLQITPIDEGWKKV